MTTQLSWHPRWAVRMFLEQDGMSQKELANLVGIDESKLSRILSGRQAMDAVLLRQMARAQDREINDYYQPPSDSTNPGYFNSDNLDSITPGQTALLLAS